MERSLLVSFVSLALLIFVCLDNSQNVVEEHRHLKVQGAQNVAFQHIPPSMSPVPASKSTKSPAFSFYASAQSISSTMSSPAIERTRNEPSDTSTDPNEKKNQFHTTNRSRVANRRIQDVVHPSFIVPGKNDNVVVLSDQLWKDKFRILTSRHHMFNLERQKIEHGEFKDDGEWMKDIDLEKQDIDFEAIEYPSYFDTFSKERLQRELFYYKTHNEKWSEKALFEIFLNSMGMKKPGFQIPSDYHWFDDDYHVCAWKGITCDLSVFDGSGSYGATTASITEINLLNLSLEGTLPSELTLLSNLHTLNLNGNLIFGTIPTHFANLHNLQSLDMGDNLLSGTIPPQIFSHLISLEELCLHSNQFIGTIPEELFDLGLSGMELGRNQLQKQKNQYPLNLVKLDLSWNMFVGTIPLEVQNLCKTLNLKTLYLEGNMITGTIPTTLGKCKSLQQLDLHYNHMQGTLPPELGQLRDLDMLLLSKNKFEGTIPTQILRLSKLQTLVLSNNQLTGTLPPSSWRSLTKLKNLALSNNQLKGNLPSSLLGLPNAIYIDLHMNKLIGSIPKEIGKFRDLVVLDLSSNLLDGSVPNEIGEIKMLRKLNITNNRLTGTIPRSVCNNFLINNGETEKYGCDAVVCPPETYSETGAASIRGQCIDCKSDGKSSNDGQRDFKRIVGQTTCVKSLSKTSNVQLPIGDVDGDGKVSQREVLRLLYLYTSMGKKGLGWTNDSKSKWHKWKDLKVHECDLPGIVCRNGDVVNIGLQEVDLCSQKNHSDFGGRSDDIFAGKCLGLPTELGLLYYLEVLNLSDSPGLLGNIPSELGQLQHLKELNLSNSPNIAGSIPTELGNALSLTNMNLSYVGIHGSIPLELGNLKQLERLDLSLNFFVSPLPESLGQLKNIKELRISRSELNGTIPESVGNMVNLENLELYGNNIEGSLPSSLGLCPFLMRIDVYNNKLTGTIPECLSQIPLLQIAHLKANSFTGTIPEGFGSHPLLTWLDVSSNLLRGQIPENLGMSASLKDLRLGDNKFQGPIPKALCSNEKINNGATTIYGCDAILCPVGMFGPGFGFATGSTPCQQCPNRETTLYLGGLDCHEYTQRDYLKMFYDMMKGDEWENKFNKDWKADGVSECDWAGVSCDDDGLIDGLSFPIAASSLSRR